MLTRMLRSVARFLEDGVTRSEIVELVPFDVTIGLNVSQPAVDVFTLTDIVEDWLGQAFANSTLGANYSRFTTVILDYDDSRRHLQATSTFVASYEGVTVWTRTGDLLVPDEAMVSSIQTQAFIEDNALLLQALKAADDSSGLGDAVTGVRASINSKGGGGDDSSSSTSGLDIIFIVAIVIAALAFLLLGFALVMAFRHSRSSKAGMRALSTPEATGDESEFNDSSKQGNSKRASAAANAATKPPSEIDPSASGIYPESVISEDISTSLTAYYQSGMAGGRKGFGNNMLNDAASVSSMESYGYSLDGYTNSIAPTNDKDDPF